MFTLFFVISINLASHCILFNFSNVILILPLFGLGKLGLGKALSLFSKVVSSISLLNSSKSFLFKRSDRDIDLV